jgi:hypothetical protein
MSCDLGLSALWLRRLAPPPRDVTPVNLEDVGLRFERSCCVNLRFVRGLTHCLRRVVAPSVCPTLLSIPLVRKHPSDETEGCVLI